MTGPKDEMVLDGNAVAGTLAEIYGDDMTTVLAECASCGNVDHIGGLIAYGDSTITMFQSAASYVDRLLRGAKVSDLPIQAVDRFETVINLKTAAKLGITVPSSLLSVADDVIE